MQISGAGCCLIDYIYHDYDYRGHAFQQLLSKQPGDGGLVPGGLVFAEDLAAFAGMPVQDVLERLVGQRTFDVCNLGGPAVVALVNAAQLLDGQDCTVTFHGALGDDAQGQTIRTLVAATPLKTCFKTVPGLPSASTVVLADPRGHGGKGERSFINTIGAANSFGTDDLSDSFYRSDVVLLGGTALIPRLHDDLDHVLARAKREGCFTVVGTVYDFRHEKTGSERWPLGTPASYRCIDLLVADAVEAMRLTGTGSIAQAAKELQRLKVGSFIITNGAKEMLVWAGGERFSSFPLHSMPVSRRVDEMLERDPSLRKDSTGCGDNFVGGALVSVAKQLAVGKRQLELVDACAWGCASGGFACMYHGGTYHEQAPGEKLSRIEPLVQAYREVVHAG